MKKHNIHLLFSCFLPIAALILSIVYDKMIVFSIAWLLTWSSDNYTEYKIAKLKDEE